MPISSFLLNSILLLCSMLIMLISNQPTVFNMAFISTLSFLALLSVDGLLDRIFTVIQKTFMRTVLPLFVQLRHRH